LQDEIQITLIATGFEGRATHLSHPTLRQSTLEAPRAQPPPSTAPPQRPQQPRTEPAYQRPEQDEGDDEYDIPAFIRRR
jgi:hypothetical protein